MKIETETTFIADDGRPFSSEDECRKHEETCRAFQAVLTEKIGDYNRNELMLGGHAELTALPYKAPWMSPFGACFIYVTDVRRVDGVVEFQLADEKQQPYNGGTAWCKADNFYSEWPD